MPNLGRRPQVLKTCETAGPTSFDFSSFIVIVEFVFCKKIYEFSFPMASKLFEKKMFKGSRSMSRSSNRSFSTDSGQMTTAPVGHLDIEVVSAEDLTAADFGGKSDPYVVLVRNY